MSALEEMVQAFGLANLPYREATRRIEAIRRAHEEGLMRIQEAHEQSAGLLDPSDWANPNVDLAHLRSTVANGGFDEHNAYEMVTAVLQLTKVGLPGNVSVRKVHRMGVSRTFCIEITTTLKFTESQRMTLGCSEGVVSQYGFDPRVLIDTTPDFDNMLGLCKDAVEQSLMGAVQEYSKQIIKLPTF